MPLHVRMLLVNDRPLSRTTLATSLCTDPRLAVVADVTTPAEALTLARTHRPDVAGIDLDDPATVEQTVRSLREAAPDTHLLLLGTSRDPAARLVDLGVRAYLDKGVTLNVLRSAIVLLVDAQQLFISVSKPPSRPSSPAETPPGQHTAPPHASVLSAREVQVMRCVAAALSNRQIASSIGITEGTVKRHLRNVLAKLGADARLDATSRTAHSCAHASMPVNGVGEVNRLATNTSTICPCDTTLVDTARIGHSSSTSSRIRSRRQKSATTGNDPSSFSTLGA